MKKQNKPRRDNHYQPSSSMIFRYLNLNPVIDARPRWYGCTRSSFDLI